VLAAEVLKSAPKPCGCFASLMMPDASITSIHSSLRWAIVRNACLIGLNLVALVGAPRFRNASPKSESADPTSLTGSQATMS
jgi:hypothetical protein